MAVCEWIQLVKQKRINMIKIMINASEIIQNWEKKNDLPKYIDGI